MLQGKKQETNQTTTPTKQTYLTFKTAFPTFFSPEMHNISCVKTKPLYEAYFKASYKQLSFYGILRAKNVQIWLRVKYPENQLLLMNSLKFVGPHLLGIRREIKRSDRDSTHFPVPFSKDTVL